MRSPCQGISLRQRVRRLSPDLSLRFNPGFRPGLELGTYPALSPQFVPGVSFGLVQVSTPDSAPAVKSESVFALYHYVNQLLMSRSCPSVVSDMNRRVSQGVTPGVIPEVDRWLSRRFWWPRAGATKSLPSGLGRSCGQGADQDGARPCLQGRMLGQSLAEHAEDECRNRRWIMTDPTKRIEAWRAKATPERTRAALEARHADMQCRHESAMAQLCAMEMQV